MITIPGRIPIHIHPLFWLLIFAISWTSTGTPLYTVIAAGVIFISVLVHEFGHALSALAFGQEAEINLVGLGGLTRRTGAKLHPWQDFIIIACGPLAGFALCLLVYKLAPAINPAHYQLTSFALIIGFYVNLYWNLLNLAPILPLDGGQLLRILFVKWWGVRGLKAMLLASIPLAAFFAIYFLLDGNLFASAIFILLAVENYHNWAGIRNAKSQDSDEKLLTLMREADHNLESGFEEEAMKKYLLIRDQTKEGMLYILSTQQIARLFAKEGNLKQAYEFLLPISKSLSPEYLRLLQQIAYRLNDWNTAVTVGEKAYHQSPSIDTALLNAFSYSLMGKAKPAVGWLNCAIQSGFSNLSQIATHAEFDLIRNTPEFQALISKK